MMLNADHPGSREASPRAAGIESMVNRFDTGSAGVIESPAA
ncbi:hypothetical protein ACFSUH_02660 [Rhodococcus jostii]